MILVDVDLLVAATMTSAQDHDPARRWFQEPEPGPRHLTLFDTR